jgi:hypothetical protein
LDDGYHTKWYTPAPAFRISLTPLPGWGRSEPRNIGNSCCVKIT